MNETEENKAPEQADKSQADKSQADKPQADKSQTDKPQADGSPANQPKVAQSGDDQQKAEQPEEDKTESEAAESDSAVTETAATEKETPAVEAKKEEKPKAAAAEAAPVRTKQPTPEDKLNISEDLPWYVVQAFSGYEASVKRSLIERIERAGLGADFGEILVPTEEVVEIRGGQKRKSERKFFPGYVLVQINLTDESWHLVKDVPRVLGFIGGTADRPAPITAKEADAILQRVQDGVDKPRPKVLFDVGEVVRVTDGPFNDFNGVVEEVNFEKNKLLVAVQIFGRSTPVELEFSQVEKA